MKLYIALLLALASKTLPAAQLSKTLSTEEAATQMVQSIENNDLAALEKLLQKYPEARDTMPEMTIIQSGSNAFFGKNYISPLAYAAHYNKPEALCILLEFGAKPHLKAGCWPVLVWASVGGNYACIQSLIESITTQEFKDRYHQEVLIYGEGSIRPSNRSEREKIMKKYHQAIAAGEAESDRYAQEKTLALQKIFEAIGIKDLALIIHTYAYGVLPRDLPKPKKIEPLQAQKKNLSSRCEIQ